MIFMKKDRTEQPITYAYVNKIYENDLPNGGKIKSFILGTREKDRDGNKTYSSWRCELIGDARRANDEAPLAEGDFISIYGIKLTNTQKKNDDGTYSKPFLSVKISDYTTGSDNSNASNLAY